MLKNICAIGAILLLSTTSTMAAVPKECAADVKARWRRAAGCGPHQGLH